MRRNTNACRAVTLVELLVASGIMLILLMALMPMLSTSTRAWQRNSADVQVTMDATLAMRRITSELRRARSVSVNTSQTQVTYVLPNGADGVVGLSGQTLVWHPAEGPTDTVHLLNGVMNIDPATGTTYPLFQLGANGRTVTVRLCVQRQTPAGVRYLRMQELVVLRNR
ncbi:MAG: prepilin-type N-terminal cleavage/methylation domain-containing protein [bacterium]|nr:prepilin-type N-terminal cleavage/methylation domain-containing protein [bacterium]